MSSKQSVLNGNQEAASFGRVGFQKWLDWLESFMLWGSDQKVLTCGEKSFVAVYALATAQNATAHRFSAPFHGGMPEGLSVKSPFGYFSLRLDKSLPPGDIISTDEGVTDPKTLERAQSTAHDVHEIAECATGVALEMRASADSRAITPNWMDEKEIKERFDSAMERIFKAPNVVDERGETITPTMCVDPDGKVGFTNRKRA